MRNRAAVQWYCRPLQLVLASAGPATSAWTISGQRQHTIRTGTHPDIEPRHPQLAQQRCRNLVAVDLHSQCAASG